MTPVTLIYHFQSSQNQEGEFKPAPENMPSQTVETPTPVEAAPSKDTKKTAKKK